MLKITSAATLNNTRDSIYQTLVILRTRDLRFMDLHAKHNALILSTGAVYCIRCLSWPLQAADWPTSHKNYDWPDSATVDRVISNGCDLIGVAYRQCRQHEWMGKYQHRLSFTRAEIVLINSWMPVQQIIESASFEPSCVKIRLRVWPVGEFPKRGINKNNFRYISPMCLKAPWTDVHRIWHTCRGRRRNHLWQIFGDRLRGVDSVGGRKLPFSIDNASRRKHRASATAQPVTTCTSFVYCSAHDDCCSGSVLLWRQCNMLCTSGFVYDVMFWHNGANRPK